MADKASLVAFGPWKGINENPAIPRPDQLADAWNVDFEHGFIYRRRGRQRIFDSRTILPTEVWYSNGSVDITSTLTDGSTSAVTRLGASEYFLVGSPSPFFNLQWLISSSGAPSVSTVTGQYWSGSAWTSLSSFVDGTIASGQSMNQTGAMTWADPGTIGTSGWRVGNDGAVTGTDQNLYWVKIACGGTALGAGSPYELSILFANATTDLRSQVNGLFEFNGRNGRRELIIGMDAPGLLGTGDSQARLFKANLSARALVPLNLPLGARDSSPGMTWRFATMNGWMLATNGRGPILRYNGTVCSVLEALPGKDFSSGAAGARSYLGSVPRAKYMDVYHNRLVLAGDPDAPNTLFLSEFDNANDFIPDDAPVGGANVWPVSTNLDVSSRENDPITGIATLDSRLVILKRRSLWVYDDASLRQVHTSIGCIAPDSAQKVSLPGGGSAVMFLSSEGVKAFDGSKLLDLSAPVDPTLTGLVSRQSMPNAVAVNYQKRCEYRLYLPINGEPKNACALIFNYRDQTWTKHGRLQPWASANNQVRYHPYEISACATASYGDTDEQLLSGDYDGNVWREDIGDDDNGVGYSSVVVFPQMGTQTDDQRTWRALRLKMLMDGTPVYAYALPDGMSWASRVSFGSATPVSASALMTNQTTYPATWTVGGGGATKYIYFLTTADVIGPTRRVAPVRMSFSQTSNAMQIALYLPGSNPHRWAILGAALDYLPREDKR